MEKLNKNYIKCMALSEELNILEDKAILNDDQELIKQIQRIKKLKKKYPLIEDLNQEELTIPDKTYEEYLMGIKKIFERKSSIRFEEECHQPYLKMIGKEYMHIELFSYGSYECKVSYCSLNSIEEFAEGFIVLDFKSEAEHEYNGAPAPPYPGGQEIFNIVLESIKKYIKKIKS